MTKPKIVTIDNVEYPLESLSDVVKQQLTNLRVVEKEIAHLKTQMAIAQTARAVFANGIKQNLPKSA